MNTYEVWLADPAGDVQSFDWGIVVKAVKIRQIGQVEVNKQPFDPGFIYCTQAALDRLGDAAILRMLSLHLMGQFRSKDAREGDFIYDVLPGDVRIVTHVGDHTAVILSEEY